MTQPKDPGEVVLRELVNGLRQRVAELSAQAGKWVKAESEIAKLEAVALKAEAVAVKAEATVGNFGVSLYSKEFALNQWLEERKREKDEQTPEHLDRRIKEVSTGLQDAVKQITAVRTGHQALEKTVAQLKADLLARHNTLSRRVEQVAAFRRIEDAKFRDNIRKLDATAEQSTKAIGRLQDAVQRLDNSLK